MKTPEGLQPLIDDGIIDEVIRALKSGKEASVYVVRSGAEIRCAKVYKDMGQRSFQQRAQYQEGRKVRGSRQARAMAKSTGYGRQEQESAWKNTEVNALYQLVAPLTGPDPTHSPINHDLRGLPPVLLQVAAREVLRCDAEAMAQRLADADVPCTLQIWAGQVHAFPVLAGLLPEAMAALIEAGAFVQQVTSAAASALDDTDRLDDTDWLDDTDRLDDTA